MSRIPKCDRDIIEQAIYLPMVIIVLERDRMIIDDSPFKLKQPYLTLVEQSIKAVQHDLKIARRSMRKENMKVWQIKHDDTFTMFSFFYKGYEEQHNYFNSVLRNKTEELLGYYLSTRAPVLIDN